MKEKEKVKDKNSESQIPWFFYDLAPSDIKLYYFGYFMLPLFFCAMLYLLFYTEVAVPYYGRGELVFAEITQWELQVRDDCENCYTATYRYEYPAANGQMAAVEGTTMLRDGQTYTYLSNGRIILTYLRDDPSQHKLGYNANEMFLLPFRCCLSAALFVSIYLLLRGYAAKRRYGLQKTKDKHSE